jgi:hypothetical protein
VISRQHDLWHVDRCAPSRLPYQKLTSLGCYLETFPLTAPPSATQITRSASTATRTKILSARSLSSSVTSLTRHIHTTRGVLRQAPARLCCTLAGTWKEGRELLLRYGIRYDHSRSHKDHKCYWLRTDDEWTEGYTKKSEKSMKPIVEVQFKSLVEIPGCWYIVDLPPMRLCTIQEQLDHLDLHKKIRQSDFSFSFMYLFLFCFFFFDNLTLFSSNLLHTGIFNCHQSHR